MASDLPEHHRMTIGEHLDELRWHVLRAVLYVAGAACILFMFQHQLVKLAIRPYDVVTAKMTDDRLVPGEGLESSVVDLVKAIRQHDSTLRAELEAAERDEAKLREQIEPSTEALSEIAAEMQAIQAELALLREQQDTLADEEPTRAALSPLEARRSELLARYERVEARVTKQVQPFLDRHAQLPRTNLTQIDPAEYFLSALKLVIVVALFLSSPLAVRELWTFISKGLYPNEKRYIKFFYPLSLAAFVAGALFGYFILIPLGLEFLLTYGGSVGIETNVAVASYLSLFTAMILVIGLIFELPLGMTFLAMIGVMNAQKYRAIRRYFLLAAFVVGAFLTPPDPVTQTLMALPMIALYELGIWLSALFGSARRAEEAPALDDRPDPPAGPSGGADDDDGGDDPTPEPTPPAEPLLKPADMPTVPRGRGPAVPVLAVESDEGALVSEIGEVESARGEVADSAVGELVSDAGKVAAAQPEPAESDPVAAAPADAEPEVLGEFASEVGQVAPAAVAAGEPELVGEFADTDDTDDAADADADADDADAEPRSYRYDPDAEDDDDEPDDVVTSAAYSELVKRRAAEAKGQQAGGAPSTEAAKQPGGDGAAPEEGADA